MAINNEKAVGDDQAWKQEVEKILKDVVNQLATLKKNQDSIFKQINGS